jgi:predicted glycogen debranching enzyme
VKSLNVNFLLAKLLVALEDTLPKIKLDSNELSNFDKAVKTEWLITNGLGGYASSTAFGMNTRKYHGLLIASFNPPVDRRVLLTKLDEEVLVGNQTYRFGANENTRGIQPEGHHFPINFSVTPFPTYTYNVDGRFQLKKTILMPQEKNISIILYDVSNASEKKAKLSIAPLVNSRHFHSVTQRDQIQWSFVQKASNQQVTIKPSTGVSTLILFSTDGRYVTGQGEWIETYFRVEAMRGESSLEHSYRPGFFEYDIAPNEHRQFSIFAAGGKDENETESVFSSIYNGKLSIEALYTSELKRREDLLENFRRGYKGVQLHDWLKWLILSTDDFIVNRESTKTKSVIAGYHWFEDWGRDSLISLPGLTLVNGRFGDARQILLTFQQYCREGIVPNRFPDALGDKPAYNTVDATLWYFNAVLQYLKYTNDFQFIEDRLWSTLESIVDYHVRGTLFNIHVDEDGLLSHGPQLTWVDSSPDGIPITPRDGKAVEIQALWYNALKTAELLANHFGHKENVEVYSLMAEKAKRSFIEKFWNQQKNCLFDVVTGDNEKDNSLRPNQTIAAALDFIVPDKATAESVVKAVWKNLLTPYGLRSLSSSDPRYVGKYGGDRRQRDQAYHNGTVWPWLLGSFVTAFLKVKSHEPRWRSFAFENFLKPLFTEGISRAGLGSVSEISDGDPPYEPNGCIAQAWSVAEPLRAYMEDVLLKRPPFEQRILSGYLY